MILSRKHRFIFFKTGKCAGSSIEGFLSTKVCGPEDTCTEISPAPPGHQIRNSGIWRQHDPAQKVLNLHPRVFNNYYTLSIERNPWDKAVSNYWHVLRNKRMGPEWLSFESYLNSHDFRNWSKTGRRMYVINNVVAVNHVMMYHTLQQELERFVRKRLKLPIPVRLGNEKGQYRKEKGDYTPMYTNNKMIQVVADLYQFEIETFGFKFGENFRDEQTSKHKQEAR